MSDLLLVCRLTLICVLAVAGVAKLRDRDQFAASLGDFPFLPAAARPTLAVVVPVAELAAAVLLALPWTLGVGLAVAALLCAAFTAVAVTTMRSPSPAGCACFGSRTTVPMGPWHVARNVTLTVLAVLGGVVAVTDGTSAPLDAAAIALAVGTAGYLTVLAVFTDDLAHFFSTRTGRS
ncbi:MauE/DoxX family redox-associated membrane protein [Yinghuangia seranimata]|uniref:MauE/DoxX family redox-associated membrane protein n=1 Tax=Yinghuangia seranimata TaxID=408067 RepID=UPI00248B5A3F|nr:MauE/DoxX family redox-associated membrane protein [Yinghuangia seranimata]MDI2128480.1 MauE/DoxX family redox-associated membrane protein [Yinghuangia seranimata]